MQKIKAIPVEEQLSNFGIHNCHIYYQMSPDTLVEQTILRGQGNLNNTGALCVETGRFTGRSPRDKYIVKENGTAETIDWNSFNNPIDPIFFSQLKRKMTDYINHAPEIWVRDAYACAHPDYRIKIRCINEQPWSNLFVHNMFLRPCEEELESFVPEWTIIQMPGFTAKPSIDGTRNENFAIISFENKMVLIGGTGYTGEIKKGVFTILNYILPKEKNVLSMHCSANTNSKGETAVFFGLSGTGKTTLSADEKRMLIGDDEHGWTNDGIFNFEGGCYAKCIDLSEEKEPQIYQAVKHGALVENTRFYNGTDEIDFACKAITENTRVSYPMHFIRNAFQKPFAATPKNIFFLTCDAYGVFPPISKLTPGQAMYQFISGYTAKVAGTEDGVTEPKATFSACFGAPFLPLSPALYAAMLGKKIKEQHVNIWLVNTGWIGGRYGTGTRIKLRYTRAMIDAALNGSLEDVQYTPHPVFEMLVPNSCSGVPAALLDTRSTWTDKEAYDQQANELAALFIKNFQQYANVVEPEILEAQPKILQVN